MKPSESFLRAPVTGSGLYIAEVASLSATAVVVCDAQGCTEWVNAAFTRLTGYDLEDLRGRKPGAVLQGPATDPATVRQISTALARGEGLCGVEILNYAKDGRPYWVLLEIQPVRDASGTIVRFVSTESDVTAQRAARERSEATARELAQSNALLAAAGRIARVGSWQFDPVAQTMVWSDVTYEIHEVERGTPIDAARAIGFYPPAHRPALERALQAQEPWDLELQIVTGRGRTIWVRAIGEPVVQDGITVAIRGVFQDIDAQRHAAEALRQERERAEAARQQLRVAIESLEDGFVLYDSDDRLVLFNERYREIYRNSADRIEVGRRFEELIRHGVANGQYPQARGREEQWIAERMAAHRSANSVVEQQLPDGRWLRIAERRTPDGGVVGFRVDITELKRATECAEAAAREAARLSSEMNAIFELSPDGFISFDASGRASYANAVLCTLLGLPAGRVRDLTLAEFDRLLAARCGPDELYLTSDQMADGASMRLTLNGPRPAMLERAVRSLRDADGHLAGLVVYLRDITEALSAERALLAQQAKFAAAFRNSADYVSIVRRSDGVFVDVNDAFEQVSGYTREEAIGRTAADLRLWVEPQMREQMLQQLHATGAVRDVSTALHRKDGAVRQVVVAAAQIDIGGEQGLMWTVRDVTEQRAAVEALRASEARFGAAFRDATDLMAILDLDGWRTLEVNEMFCRTVGLARAAALGCTAQELGMWPDPPEGDDARRQLLSAGALSNVPFRLRRRDGTQLHCLLSASIVTIDGARCVLITARDISLRVAAEESARELTARLQSTVAALEEVNRQNVVLSEMRDLLQACHTPQEVHEVAAHFVPGLLPGTRGALYHLNESRTALEASFAWGDEALRDAVFAPDSCWALRRGRLHHVAGPYRALRCGHLHHVPDGGYLCLPMAAQGERFGLMHVQYESAGEAQGERALRLDSRENFLRTMTEHIALAMSNARLRENLRVQASRDALTGLVNRRFMDEQFERDLSRCRRRDLPLAVFMIDIDHFKAFNDRHGHEAGDHVLRLVADALGRCVRFEDILCRYGGEEFLVVLPEIDQRTAQQRAQQMRERVSELAAHFRDAPLGAVTISLGVALFPAHGATPEVLMRRADEALYEAKRAGRNRVVLSGTESG